jgi:hypothetical protein
MRYRLLAAALLSALTLPSAEGLRVGRAEVVITPPAGVPMAGYYSTRLATGTHDDLHAKALVLQSGDTRAALIACDLISVPPAVIEEARRLIEQQTGIPQAHVMISATHSHTGPLMMGGGARDAAYGGELEPAKRYIKDLPGKIAKSAVLAAAKLEPATAQFAKGNETSINFNRRFFMKDGTVGWNPGKLNPNIVKPAGPVDPDVALVYFESASRTPLASYVNFALHLDTVGGLEISADYPATMAALLAKAKGPGMLTLFTNGAAGNINHIDVKTSRPQKGHEEAARIGTALADEVLRTFDRLQPAAAAGDLKVRSRTLQLQPAPLGAGDVERAQAIVRDLDAGKKVSFLDTVFAWKVIETAERKGKPLDAEVQVITLGSDIAWVALPGEIFTELGMAIKKASPYAMTMVVELAHGPVTYFPNEAAVPQGNYEVVTSRVAPGSGERLVEAAKQLLAEAHSHAKVSFRSQEIGKELGVVYAVTTADVNADGKPDIVAINNTQILWFENPAWTKHIVAEHVTKNDNVSVAPLDIDRDGRMDFALGADWQSTNTASGGSIHWVTNAGEVHDIGTEPTVHRMRWMDIDGDGRPELIVAPLHGRGTKAPDWTQGNGARILVYKIPADPARDPWPMEVADESLHIVHNFFPVGQEIWTASAEGIHALTRSQNGKWSKRFIAEGTPGEIKPGQVNGKRHLATVEPWHGNSIVVYEEGKAPWKRVVVDSTLSQAHAIGWGDFDRDGSDELIAGWRGKPWGMAMYKLTNGTWNKTPIDDGVAVEDLTIADLDGDGRPEIIAGGRATGNLRIYWPRN